MNREFTEISVQNFTDNVFWTGILLILGGVLMALLYKPKTKYYYLGGALAFLGVTFFSWGGTVIDGTATYFIIMVLGFALMLVNMVYFIISLDKDKNSKGVTKNI